VAVRALGGRGPRLMRVKASRMAPVLSRKVASSWFPVIFNTTEPMLQSERTITGWFSDPRPRGAPTPRGHVCPGALAQGPPVRSSGHRETASRNLKSL